MLYRKCDNIFVNGASGVIKLGDLGLATLWRGLTTPQSVLGGCGEATLLITRMCQDCMTLGGDLGIPCLTACALLQARPSSWPLSSMRKSTMKRSTCTRLACACWNSRQWSTHTAVGVDRGGANRGWDGSVGAWPDRLCDAIPHAECKNAAQIYRKVTTGVLPSGLDKVCAPEHGHVCVVLVRVHATLCCLGSAASGQLEYADSCDAWPALAELCCRSDTVVASTSQVG